MPVHPRAAIAPSGTTKKASGRNDRECRSARTIGDAHLETAMSANPEGYVFAAQLPAGAGYVGNIFGGGNNRDRAGYADTASRRGEDNTSTKNLLWVRACLEEDRYGYKITEGAPRFKSFPQIARSPAILHTCASRRMINRSPRTSPFRTAAPPPRCGPRFRDPTTGILRPERPEFSRPCAPDPERNR